MNTDLLNGTFSDLMTGLQSAVSTITQQVTESARVLSISLTTHTDTQLRPWMALALSQEEDISYKMAAWKRAIFAELDELRVKDPVHYECIPHFLATPIEEIDGLSYARCFYGRLCDGDGSEAARLANRIHTPVPAHTHLNTLMTPIEALLLMVTVYRKVMETSCEGISLEEMRNWIQEHYRANRAVIEDTCENIQVSLPEERGDNEQDGNRCGEARADLCGAGCSA